jgi:hypothetical protein
VWNRNQSNLSILEPGQEALHESKEPAKAGKKQGALLLLLLPVTLLAVSQSVSK